jgi:hypothetical protein
MRGRGTSKEGRKAGRPITPSLPALLPSLAVVLLAGCPGPNPVVPDARGDYQRMQDALSCLPNNNGTIELSKLAFPIGVNVPYRVNPPGTLVDVDVAGASVDGVLQWDFSSPEGDLANVKLEDVNGFWFAKSFPTATFAVGGDIKGETLQVFHLDTAANQLLLLGLASRAPDVTLMIYDQPVLNLRYPLKAGDSFKATGTVQNGKLNGLPIATTDTYEVKVDAIGKLLLPTLKFDNTLRVLVTVTSSAVGGAKATVRQAQWFHECYGELVRAVSQKDESNALFTKATELRRMSMTY